MLGVEDIGGRGIVNNDGVFQIPSDLGEVLDIIALVVVAGLPEEPVVNHFVDIELIQERVAILESGC